VASRPLGFLANVSRAPIECAYSVICAAVAGMPPLARPSALAASLPEESSSPSRSWRTVYSSPGTSPTLVPSMAASSGVATTVVVGERRGARVRAVRAFIVLAGRACTCASLARMTRPSFASATT